MASENEPNHYNYQRLDSFLKNDYDPIEIGNRLAPLVRIYFIKREQLVDICNVDRIEGMKLDRRTDL